MGDRVRAEAVEPDREPITPEVKKTVDPFEHDDRTIFAMRWLPWRTAPAETTDAVNQQFPRACYSKGMKKFSRENSAIDILPLIGLVLIEAAVYLTWGLAATLAFAGAALIVVAVAVAAMPVGRAE